MTEQSPESYLKSKGIKYKKTGPNDVRFSCPCCNELSGFDLNLKSGAWNCKRASCGEKGSFYELKAKLGDAVQIMRSESIESRASSIFKTFTLPMDKMVHFLWNSEHGKEAREYLESRSIHHRIARMARLGWASRPVGSKSGPKKQGSGLIAIPYFRDPSDPSPYNGKMRWVPPEPMKDGKLWRYTKFRSGEMGLYCPLGLNLSVPVVLVGGEIDALSLCQLGLTVDGFDADPCNALGFCPVGVPNGEGSWSDVWTDLLEKAEDIIIAFDADDAGHKGAETVALKLGSWRTRVAPDWPGSDPNECLQNGTLTLDCVHDLISRARSKVASRIVDARSYASTVAKERLARGSQGWSTGLPRIDAMIGNLRPWEMNVITGHTGSGKTRFCMQILVNACTKLGLKALLCPFEGGPGAGLATMAHQLHGEGLPMLDDGDGEEEIREKHEIIERRVSALGPDLYILNHVGEIEPAVWRETLKYCLGRLGVQIVVIDLLNKMIRPGPDMWTKQSEIVLDTHTLISDRSLGCAHCLMIAHPATTKETKNRDNYYISLADLKGGSDLSQNPEGAIQIYRPRDEERTEFKDSRGYFLAAGIVIKQGRNSRGREGQQKLWFIKESEKFTDEPPPEDTTKKGEKIGSIFKTNQKKKIG